MGSTRANSADQVPLDPFFLQPGAFTAFIIIRPPAKSRMAVHRSRQTPAKDAESKFAPHPMGGGPSVALTPDASDASICQPRPASSLICCCKPSISNDQILVQLEKFAREIKLNGMTLNQRVPRSSPRAPTRKPCKTGDLRESPNSRRCCAGYINKWERVVD